MAQAAAAKLEFEPNGYAVSGVYNFGCPRALNAAAALRYNERLGTRTFRVVNNEDFVCEVPFEELGFVHVGQLRFLTADGRLLEANVVPVRPDGLRAHLKALKERTPLAWALDHLPDRYTGKLVALCETKAVP
jgi:hypothetical protein